MTRVRPRHTLLLASGLALCGLGCGGTNPAPGGAPAASAPASKAGAPGAKQSAAPRSPGAAAARGEPPPACDFRVGETCFASDTEACRAAGCRQGGCIVLESYPAQITCK